MMKALATSTLVTEHEDAEEDRRGGCFIVVRFFGAGATIGDRERTLFISWRGGPDYGDRRIVGVSNAS